MKIISILFLIIISPVFLFAAGDTGLAVLKIGVGARAAALGEAFVATADDASGIYWNPAGSVWIEKRQAHFTHNSWIQGIKHNVVSLTFPTSVGTFGIGFLLNSIDGFEYRTFASEEPQGQFSSQDFSISINYSRKIGDNLSIGTNFKYINEKIYVENANGYLFDLGARYLTPVNGFSLALVLQNFGFTTKMIEENIRLPQTLRAGGAYTFPFAKLDKRLLLSLDYVQIFDNMSYLNIGMQVKPVSTLALRLGYQAGMDEKDLSAGFGIHFGIINVDYAYVPFGRDLGDSHRFSLTTTF